MSSLSFTQAGFPRLVELRLGLIERRRMAIRVGHLRRLRDAAPSSNTNQRACGWGLPAPRRSTRAHSPPVDGESFRRSFSTGRWRLRSPHRERHQRRPKFPLNGPG